ncbi:ABC transporter ATP-binding protein [Paenibacillus jilunlii]|uniref:Bacitracin ABC transporter ATP-binding protein n=1 Tax=Paenibacillus jilunlii TaxID=682956 RepID=A0A1G9FR87_9BACL|nr:ABC transporter ATP-binding protein [Paenibacillus jilunlii]KWX71198.1 bacitracin ABC transporter ATP-binding protein [Paenibacillus jilunlii]SDK90852.1 bacitracin transport system ATP-binding protein [Paenibacillus jilunlii]
MEYILKTRDLTKKYKTHTAVDGISISLKKGEIYGFLGQNGAGKTTTIRMIMGLIKPTSGRIELFGENAESSRKAAFERIGSMIEIPGFYPNLTAAENLDIHRRMMGMGNKESIEESLEQAGLLDARNKRVKNFSLGMKQRLGIARSLLHHPDLLILDEPTNGLDPAGIKEVRQLVMDLASKRNIGVLVSSHILSEVQQMATKLGIVHHGRLVEEIEQQALQMKNRHCVEFKVSNDREAVMLLEQKLGIYDYSVPEPGVVRVFEKLSDSAVINRLLVENRVDVGEITMLRETLEDYFLSLTGGDLSA